MRRWRCSSRASPASAPRASASPPPRCASGPCSPMPTGRSASGRSMAEAVSASADVPPPDGAALAYALRSPGKRVRAALVLAGYRSLGGQAPAIAGVAAAVETVHTYSLVHDDLPCMDDDDLRRGRPTTHVRFGVPVATRV